MSSEGRLLETASEPEITEMWDKDFGECSAQIMTKHRHGTQTRQVNRNRQNVAKQK